MRITTSSLGLIISSLAPSSVLFTAVVMANIIVILVAVAIGTVYVKDRFAAPSRQTDEVKASDKLATLEGWDWGAQDRTLVLVPQKGCHFCEDSSPSYQQLIAQQQAGSKTAVVFTSVTSRTSTRQPHIENPRGALGFGNHRHNRNRRRSL